MGWSAFAGNPGNELADQYAKLATKFGEHVDIPPPYSFPKRRLEHFVLENWQRYWDDFDTGVL
ncbi:hypothetical protein AVEN_22961-1, partial [Araneus ventricosus]